MQGVDRCRRIGERIQRELAAALRELNDPRIDPMVTIGEVVVSRDLSYADVYYTLLGATESLPRRERERTGTETAAGLAQAAGHLRSTLAHRIRMKKMPRLRFRYDDTEDRARRLDRIIDALPDARRRVAR